MFAAMIGFSGPRLTPPASPNTLATRRPGTTAGANGAPPSPSAAGSGPAWPGNFHTTSPTAMPVAVSMLIIHREEKPPMPSASGRSSHRTSSNCSARALIPRNSRLAATPTTRAGRICGSSSRSWLSGAEGDGAGGA